MDEDYEVLRSPHERSLEVGMSLLYRRGLSSPTHGGRFARESSAPGVGSLPEYNEEESVEEGEEEDGYESEDEKGRYEEVGEVEEEGVGVNGFQEEEEGDGYGGIGGRYVEEEEYGEQDKVGGEVARTDMERLDEERADEERLDQESVGEGSVSEESIGEDMDEERMFARARRGSFYGDDEIGREGNYEHQDHVDNDELKDVFKEDFDQIVGARPVEEHVLHEEREETKSVASSLVEDESSAGVSDNEEIEAVEDGIMPRDGHLDAVENRIIPRDEDADSDTENSDNVVLVDVKVPVSKAVVPRSLRHQRRGIRMSERIGEEEVVVNADRAVERIEGLKLMPEGTLVGPRLEERPLFVVTDKKKRPVNSKGPPLFVERAGARPDGVYSKDGRVKRLGNGNRRRNTRDEPRGETGTPWHGGDSKGKSMDGRGSPGRRKRSRRRGERETERGHRKQGGFFRRLLGGKQHNERG